MTLMQQQAAHEGVRSEARDTLSSELRCPITLDIMHDPVFLTDGHVFEREAIEDWLQHSSISPLTGKPLSDTRVVPSPLLRRLCEEYRLSRC